MFSKAKSKDQTPGRGFGDHNDAGDASIGEAPARRPQQTSTRPAPRPRPAARADGVPSIISADMLIRGTIETSGEIQFDGELDGDIRARGVVIGEGATVHGEVVAEKVRISGTIDGSIRATEVELASSALVRGDILHTSLSISTGARFDGNCRHSDDPISGDGHPADGAGQRPAPAKAPMPKGAAAAERTNAGEEPAASVSSIHDGPSAKNDVSADQNDSADAARRDTTPHSGNTMTRTAPAKRPAASTLR